MSVHLKTQTVTSQQYGLLRYVTPGQRKLTRKGKSTKTMEEVWNNKQKNPNEKTNVGKYQKPSSTDIIKKLFGSSVNNHKNSEITKTSEQSKTTNSSIQQNNEKRDKTEQRTKRPEKSNTLPDTQGGSGGSSAGNSTVRQDEQLFHFDAMFARTVIDISSNVFLKEVYRRKTADISNIHFLTNVKNNITTLNNVGNSCWFNAVIHMLCNAKFMQDVNEQFHMQLSYEERLRNVSCVFDKVGKGEDVAIGQLQSALYVPGLCY